MRDIAPQLVLREALKRNPRANVDEIRCLHPVFRSMSFDQLSLRLGQAIDHDADPRDK